MILGLFKLISIIEKNDGVLHREYALEKLWRIVESGDISAHPLIENRALALLEDYLNKRLNRTKVTIRRGE